MYEKKANSLDGIGAATAKPEQQWQQPALGTVAARKAIFGSMINGMAPIRPNKSESHRKLPPHIPVTLSTVKKNWASVKRVLHCWHNDCKRGTRTTEGGQD